jgi:intracellular sulfur oxidation DsrE/DsrF family protein
MGKIQIVDKTEFERAVEDALLVGAQVVMNASAFGKTVEELQTLGEAIQYASDKGVDVVVCANKLSEVNE